MRVVRKALSKQKFLEKGQCLRTCGKPKKMRVLSGSHKTWFCLEKDKIGLRTYGCKRQVFFLKIGTFTCVSSLEMPFTFTAFKDSFVRVRVDEKVC